MRRTLTALALLALGALACSLGSAAPSGATPTGSADVFATGAAATLTALPAGTSAAPTLTPPPAPSNTPFVPPSNTPASTSATEGAQPATAAPATQAATTAAPAATPAAATGCTLAYTDQASLFCLPESGTPQSLATGAGLFGPALSPDGALIAYQVAITDGVSQLWIAATTEGGPAPHVLVGQDQLPSADGSQINSPNHYQWLAGTHTLAFDTRYIPTAGPGGPGEYINADLWTVDADSGTLKNLLPAKQAGTFAASPNGHTLAVSRPTGLDLLDADGSHRHQDVISYLAVVTYAEYAYKPAVQWSADGSYFTVGIPTQDPTAPNSAITFYHIGTDGTVERLGDHPGNYVFGGNIPPQFAPDGAHVVYSVADPASKQEALHMLSIQSDALGDNAFDTQASPTGWGWSPDSQVYAYADVPGNGGGMLYATGPGVEQPHVFADHLAGLAGLRWAGGAQVVFLAQMDGGDWGLFKQTTGGDPAAVQKLVGGLNAQSSFDVRP